MVTSPDTPTDGFLTAWSQGLRQIPADGAPDTFAALLWARHHLTTRAAMTRRDADRALGTPAGGRVAHRALCGIRAGLPWQTALQRAVTRALPALTEPRGRTA